DKRHSPRGWSAGRARSAESPRARRGGSPRGARAAAGRAPAENVPGLFKPERRAERV
ncbi:MAG: hypothetical protein AVDCRST_MAG89-5202, partial [uncultured Gemmatimonadetes bacterium]